MGKKYLLLIFCTVIIFKNLCCIQAYNTLNIKLTDVEKVVYDRFIPILAEIHFPEKTNREACLFSYHVYSGEEQIKFDNERVPIKKDLNGRYTAKINVDLTDEIYNGYENLIIQFDIINSQELFWFSQQSDFSFNGAEIEYQNINKLGVFEYLEVQFRRYMVEIIINVVVSMLFWGSLIACYKKEKDNF